MPNMKRWLCLGLTFASLLRAAPGQTNGFFADFSTSLGAFTVWLDHERAPRAVASFVGLATGEISWADPQGNIWQGRKFYDGSIFHRVLNAITTNGTVQTNGIAIQGGGIPSCGISYAYLPGGPADSDGYGSYFITTNPPGVTTNDFIGGLIPFTTANAAAVPTNYVFGGEMVATNAAALTRTVLYLLAWSSNATKYVANTYSAESWYTNSTLQEVETTNWATIYTVTTNTGATPEVLLHRVQLSMATTTTIRGLVANTNFANAGYYALDSATNGLAHSNGVISMANSGPNTDGSQFFITATNVPYWDGSYTVFGHVTTGMNVVTSIAVVAVQGAGSRPVADIVLSNVVIRRVGAAAAAFNVASQGLPVVESAGIRVDAAGGAIRVEAEIPAYSECRFRISTNGLRSWSPEDWGYFTNAASHRRQINLPAGAKAFYHVSTVRYPAAWSAPTSHVGKTFNFYWDTEPITHYQASFTSVPYTWTKTQGTNSLSGNLFEFPYAPYWTRFPYSAKLYFTDNLAQYSYSLWFDPGKVSNRFTCTVTEWLGGGYGMTGTFTVQ